MFIESISKKIRQKTAKRAIAFLFGLGILLHISFVYAAWVSPTGSTDPTGQWSNDVNAYDSNTSSYASHAGAAGWRGFLQMSFPNVAYCDRVRVSSDFGYGIVDLVDIDVYTGGGWVDVYQGVINDVAWTEITFAAQTNVTGVRFRYHYLAGGWQFWLYEMEVWSGTPPAPPTVQTDAATSTTTTTANLHGTILTDGGETCEYSFEYGLTTAYGSTTAWTGSLAASDTFSELITGLTPGVNYHFRARARNTQGTAVGSDMTFFTGSPSSGWVSPTGNNDPDGNWVDEPDAYDDELGTYAYHYHDINDPDGQWSSWLYLTISSITSDRIRFYPKSGADIDICDVDVYRNAAWTNVYYGNPADKAWTEQGFAQGTVTQARVRFHVNANNKGLYWELYEFDFRKVSLNNPTLAWTGEANYVADGVDPESGYTDTNFTFRVQYTDNDNDGPATIQVWVDKNGDGDYGDAGEVIDLEVDSTGAANQHDGDYTNGEIFTITTTIPWTVNGTNVSYRFYAHDGTSAATGTPTTAINLPDIYPTLTSITLSDQDGVNSPDAEYTNGQTVAVTLVAEGTPVNMMLSESATFVGGVWVAYNANTTYTFTNGTNELKTVYCKLQYAGPPESQTKNDTITLDTVAPNVPANTLTAPNGAETWAEGSVQNITWTQANITDANIKPTPIALFYSIDSGGTFPNTIATGEANDGTYPWTVADEDTFTAQVRITAYDLAGNEASDESDADFTIMRAPVLDWTGEANYVADGVNPEVGYSTTNFVFRVEYTDASAPVFMRLYLDRNGDGDYGDAGEVIDMNEDDILDVTYSDGKIYTYTTTITYGPNTDNCSYYFAANDGVYDATGAPTTPINAPDVLYTLSLSLSSATYNFGIVDPGTYTTASSSIDITNDGEVAEDFKMQIISSPAAWTTLETDANPGNEQYKLLGVFNSVAPGNIYVGDVPAEGTADIIFESTEKDCDATNFSGDEDGDDIAVTGTVHLWFRIGTPSTTAQTTQQSIIVTVEAFDSSEF